MEPSLILHGVAAPEQPMVKLGRSYSRNEEEEKTLLSGKNERQQNYLKDPYIGPTHLGFFDKVLI